MSKLISDKCQAIMQATLELIAEQGFHATPTSQIANRAGVGVGSIYRYFKDKDELIHAIHEQLEKKLHLALVEGLPSGLPLREHFIHLITHLIRHLVNNPREFKFLEQYFNSPFGIEKRREKFLDEEGESDFECEKPFRGILDGRREGTVKDLPKPLLHALTFGPAIVIVRDHHAGLIDLDDELARKVAQGCWDAIKTQ